MRVLIDECLPVSLHGWLQGHECKTVQHMGWKSFENGTLLPVAEKEGFDVLLTADGKMRGQQNMAGRMIAILAIPTNKRKVVQSIVPQILESLAHVQKGEFHRMVITGPHAEWKDSHLHAVEQDGRTRVRKYKAPT